jgi:hypothetical protein
MQDETSIDEGDAHTHTRRVRGDEASATPAAFFCGYYEGHYTLDCRTRGGNSQKCAADHNEWARSKNGTLLEGTLVESLVMLSEGSTLRFGSVELILHCVERRARVEDEADHAQAALAALTRPLTARAGR